MYSRRGMYHYSYSNLLISQAKRGPYIHLQIEIL
jgi:hypothetical protein